jgi:D-alanyl-D-alanine carboxypeptidase
MRPSRPWLIGWFLAFALAPPGLAPAAAAAPALPATAPAQRLGEILARINAGDRDTLTQYAKTRFTPGMLQPDVTSIVDFMMAQYRVNGGYDVRRVIQSSADQIAVLVQGRRATDRWMRLVVGTEPQPPHRVQGLFLFQASAAQAQDDDRPVTEAGLPARLGEALDRIAAADGFSGSVCLARGDSTLLLRAWGSADREAGVRNRPDTRFTIASVGKMFTAVAVAQLIEAGKLRFDDPAARYVPNWLAPAARSITIAELLEHRSGLGDFLDSLADDHSGRRFDRLDDYRGFAVADTPAFAPGSGFQYSNVGYLVLGAVIEAVSGETWDHCLASRIFAPARMTATSALRLPSGQGSIATGYVRLEHGGWSRVDHALVGSGSPAGGSVSTVGDLAAFGRALLAGTLISPAMLDSLTTPRVELAGTGHLYGRGFTVTRGDPGHRVFGHAGGFPGVGALVEVNPRSGWILAVLSNTTDGASVVGDAWHDLLARCSASAGAR